MSIEISKVRLLETKKGNGLLLHIDRGEEGSAVFSRGKKRGAPAVRNTWIRGKAGEKERSEKEGKTDR